MNEHQFWLKVRGLDTEGIQILSDINRLHAGEMNEEEVSELMSDLVRDGMVPNAGYSAIPLLIGAIDCH